MKNQAFIFDWSGTLSNNFDLVYRVCSAMFVELGREPIALDEFRRTMTIPYMNFWNKYFPDLTLEKQNDLYSKYIHEAGQPEIFPAVGEILNYLREREYKMFVVSSDFATTLLPEIERAGFTNFFTKIFSNVHDKKSLMPNVVDEFALDKASTFYIGDTSGDVEAGHNAGIKTIGITWGFQHREIISAAKPDFLIDQIGEIRGIV